MPLPQGKYTLVCMGQYSNEFTQSMHQIAYFESPKCKILLKWEGETPLPHAPHHNHFATSPGISHLRKTQSL